MKLLYKVIIKNQDGKVIEEMEFENEHDKDLLIKKYDNKPEHYIISTKEKDK